MKFDNNKNYIFGRWGIGIANTWALWFLPIFFTVTLIPVWLGYPTIAEMAACTSILLLIMHDLYLRIFKSDETLLNGLTFPDKGYIFHVFILPIPLWMIGTPLLFALCYEWKILG